MIGFLIEQWTVGVDKVLDTLDIGALKSRNLIDIHKSTVKNGDGDALAAISDAMQTMTIEHLNLFATMTIGRTMNTVPRVELEVGLYLYLALDAIGGCPHIFVVLYKSLLANLLEQSGIGRANQNGVVPATGTNDLCGNGEFAGGAISLASYALDGLEIACANGQIGRIEG